MNGLWSRLLKFSYRKEPISSFVLTIGLVDAAIGGLDQSSSLLVFGVGAVGLALVLRWWLVQRNRSQVIPQPVTQLYLPEQSSRPQLPLLSVSKKRR